MPSFTSLSVCLILNTPTTLTAIGELLKTEEEIFFDKALTDPMALMKETFSIDKFLSYVKRARVTPKEIRRWYAYADVKMKHEQNM